MVAIPYETCLGLSCPCSFFLFITFWYFLLISGKTKFKVKNKEDTRRYIKNYGWHRKWWVSLVERIWKNMVIDFVPYFYIMELSHNQKELTSYSETYQISSCLVSVVFCSWRVLYTSVKRFVSLMPIFFEKSFEVLIIWEYDQVIESFSVTTVLD